ncbi:MAG: ribonuclease D [Kordiimonadaceae bacterium]|nr:ribonuclease D [Kordiimonadaceae bacterium]MBT6032832.1 ribonuclease D [Kordiimonadaceae bacterium]MBT7582219.1 ribonuclease D [Kordiimonadaceae bacterium]
MTITLHKGDLSNDVSFEGAVAIDTETLGLNPNRDRLCLVQLSSGDGNAHLVQIAAGQTDAPNLVRILEDPKLIKIFHFARFDVAVVKKYLNADVSPVYCTKIASKLVRTYTDRHGLKDLSRELLSVDLSKQQQSSNWGADELSQAQLEYAASDVYHLHKLMDKLNQMLEATGRSEFAQECFDFLPTRCELDLAGWENTDIFAHS